MILRTLIKENTLTIPAEQRPYLSSPANTFQNAVPRFVTGVATTHSGKACAFVTFTPIYGLMAHETTGTENHSGSQGCGWAVDLMRRIPDAPPGVMELLLVRAIERFRSCGVPVVSLGMVAMADTRKEMTSGQQQLAQFAAIRITC